jgi:hypothetical protein
MPYEVDWLVAGRVIRARCSGILTIHELEENNYRVLQLLDEGEQYKVHILVDNRNLEQFPANVDRIRKSTELMAEHPALGWVVTVNATNRILAALGAAMAVITGVRHKNFSRTSEALAFLQAQDETLPPLPILAD